MAEHRHRETARFDARAQRRELALGAVDDGPRIELQAVDVEMLGREIDPRLDRHRALEQERVEVTLGEGGQRHPYVPSSVGLTASTVACPEATGRRPLPAARAAAVVTIGM